MTLFGPARLGGGRLGLEPRSHVTGRARVHFRDVRGQSVHGNLLAAVPTKRLARRDVVPLHSRSACGLMLTRVKPVDGVHSAANETVGSLRVTTQH